MILLVGCNPVDSADEAKTAISYAGDPNNFTSSGFPRHVYPIRNCDFEIQLMAPFEVSEGGFGDADIRVPIALLDDPTIDDVATGGVDAQSRVSYAFPSLYRGEGMKEWFASGVRAQTAALPRPLEATASTLGSKETLKLDGTRGDTRYFGKLAGGRETAIFCSATDWRNPTCHAELPIGDKGQRYLIVFPPKTVGNLARMIEIGDELFSGAAATCRN